MKRKVNDVLIRAGKTLWQASLASLVASIPAIIELIPKGWVAMKPVLVSAVVGALAAGFSAMWNGVIAPAINKGKIIIPVAEENGGEASVESK